MERVPTAGQFLALALWAAAALYTAYRRGFFRLPYKEPVSPPHISFLKLIVAFAATFLLPGAIVVLFANGRGYGELVDAPTTTALPLVATWGMLLIVLLCWWFTGKESRRRLFEWGGGSRWWRAAGLGALSWLLIFPFASLVGSSVEIFFTYLLGSDSTEQVAVSLVRSVMADKSLFVLNALSLIVMVPVTEELLFRGFLYSFLRRKLSMGWSITVCALLFAVFHYHRSQGAVINLTLLFTLALLGGFLAYIYERERSLWAPIALHATFNLMSILALIGGLG